MPSEAEQLVAKRLSELPADVQQAILSVDVGKKIQTIGAMFGLHIDQLGLLEDEVMLVMLGFTDPNNFADALVDHLHIPKEISLQITAEISSAVFIPIRESMQAFMSVRAQQSTASQPHQPATTATQRAFTQPIVTPAASKPPGSERPYTADPYREPVE